MPCPEPPPDPATVSAALHAFLDRLAAAVVADLDRPVATDPPVADDGEPPPHPPSE